MTLFIIPVPYICHSRPAYLSFPQSFSGNPELWIPAYRQAGPIKAFGMTDK